MWQVHYMQCPRGHTWEFKFDHVPLEDGRWHKANRDSNAVYRVEHEAIQYCIPGPDIPEPEWQNLLAQLKVCGPIRTDDEVQITITRQPDGYWMSALHLEQSENVPIKSLTRPDLTAAYRELRRLTRPR